MGLVVIFCDYLLDSEELGTAFVLAQPHQTETSSAQQLNLLAAVGKAVSKHFILLFGEVVLVGRNGLRRLLTLLFNCHHRIWFFMRTTIGFTAALIDLNAVLIEVLQIVFVK